MAADRFDGLQLIPAKQKCYFEGNSNVLLWVGRDFSHVISSGTSVTLCYNHWRVLTTNTFLSLSNK